MKIASKLDAVLIKQCFKRREEKRREEKRREEKRREEKRREEKRREQDERKREGGNTFFNLRFPVRLLLLRLLLFAVRVCTARVCPFFFLVLVRVCVFFAACNLLEDDTAFWLGFFFPLGLDLCRYMLSPIRFHGCDPQKKESERDNPSPRVGSASVSTGKTPAC